MSRDATGRSQQGMTSKNKWPLGHIHEDGEEYVPDSGIKVVQNWPQAEIRGHGVVLDKNGNIKEDLNGSHSLKRRG